MKVTKNRLGWTALAVAVLLSSGCAFLNTILGQDEDDAAGEPTPVLDVTPAPPTVSGTASRVEVTGSISSSSLSFTWDFQDLGASDTVLTNGAMGSQIGSGNADGTVSVWLTSDYDTDGGGQPEDDQGASDWYLRFTLGGLTLNRTVYNHKDTFAIPTRAYSQITLSQGPSPSVQYRNREHSDALSQTAQTVVVLSENPSYDAATDRLRIRGSMRSEWNGGSDWVQANFSVLFGGPDDRNASTTQATLRNVFE